MLLLLKKLFREIITISKADKSIETSLFHAGIGLYLGWSTIAIVLNIGVFLFSKGISLYSALGITLQAALIALATLHAIYMLQRFLYSKVLFITFWWAFVGVVVGLF